MKSLRPGSTLLIFAMTSTLTYASKKGDWISSGGDAVACFATKEVARAAEAQIVKYGRLDEPYLSQITEARSLDLIEIDDNNLFSFAYQSKNFETLLAERTAQIKAMSPLFTMYAQLLEPLMAPAQWQAQPVLDEIDDSVNREEIRKSYPNCVLAQVFDRRSLSRDAQKPKVEMNYQPKVWSKLKFEADRVALYYHELFYAVGREVGAYAEHSHENSNAVRAMVRVVMGNHFSLKMPKSERLGNKDFRQLINHLYGDFVLLFISDIRRKIPAPEPGLGPSQASRLLAFYEFVADTRKFVDDCMRRPPPPAGEQTTDCRALAMHPVRLTLYLGHIESDLADEVAFLIHAYWVMDIGANVFNAENLMTWDFLRQPTALPNDAQKKQLRRACECLRDRQDWYAPEMSEVVSRAKRYCALL